MPMSNANATLNGAKEEVQVADTSPRKRVQVVYAQPLPPALTSDSIKVTQVTQKTSQQPVSYESLEVGQLFSRVSGGACVYLKVSKSKAVALDDAKPMKLSPDQQMGLRVHRVWLTTF